MNRNFLSRIAIFILASFFLATWAHADVVKIVVNDTIQPIVVERVERAIDEAKRTHADALLIEISTPGGLMDSMEDIIHKILEAPVPVIVYVAPSGNTASSAGFYILEAADVAAMAPFTNTGAAHPVLGSGQTMDPVLKEKLENYGASLMRSYVGKRGRNVEAAESAVRQSKSFTADEALQQHLVDYIARDDADLFRQLEGKTITRFDGSKVTLALAGKPVHVYEPTVRERTLSFLLNPNLMILLFPLAVLAIWFEFSHPGAVVPGVVGFIALLLALYVLNLLPYRGIALVMMLSAFLMFALEAKYQTHGAIATGGIGLLLLGMLLLVDGPIPEMRVKVWTAAAVAIPFGLITVFLMNIAIRARRNKVVTGEQGLVGETGVAVSALTPAGKVLLRGALWNAVAPFNVEVGQQVVVRGIENLVLRVEPVSQTATLSPARL